MDYERHVRRTVGFRKTAAEVRVFFLERMPSYYGSMLLFAVLYFVLSNAMGEGLGLSNIFRDRPDVQTVLPGANSNSPTFWTSAIIAFSACLIMVFPSFEPYLGNFYGRLNPDGVSRRTSFVLFCLCTVFVYAVLAWKWSGADSSPPVEGELWRAALGIPLGLLAFGIAFGFGYLARVVLDRTLTRRIRDLRTEIQDMQYKYSAMSVLPPSRKQAHERRYYDVHRKLDWRVMLRTIILKVAFTAPMMLCLVLAFYAGNLIPAVALLSLILFLFLVFKFIWIFPPAVRVGALVLIGVFLGASYDVTGEGGSGIGFKHTFDHITGPDGQDQYLNPVKLAQHDVLAPPPETCGPNGTPLQQVDFASSLRAWKNVQQQRYGQDKPKLVMVATSGGAYRASFWTALVLDKLSDESDSDDLRGISDGVRIITGASGGMVGAAYFAANASLDRFGANTLGVTSSLSDDIILAQTISDDRQRPYFYSTRTPVPRDSLSGVAQHLLQSDLRSIFRKGLAPMDRGKVLENHWLRLSVPFIDLAEGEAEGWRPSLIFSPMLVETGQPLLISNLDMGFLPKVAKGEAVEMFSLFPCAQQSFRAATAVRMNATFPFISPAISLPTEPRRRVVDAGYYDNYGVSLINAMLSQSSADCVAQTDTKELRENRRPFCFREWIRNETSGVLLIEIRAFGLNTEDEDSDECRAMYGLNTSGTFEFLTSPVEAVLSARSRSMVFRNEQGRRRIKQFDHELEVSRVVFPFCGAGSMNWIVPPDEFKQMQAALEAQWPDKRKKLVDVWARR